MNWQPLSKTDYISIVWPCAASSLKEGVSLQQLMEKLNNVVKAYGLAGVNYHLADVNPAASFKGYYAHSEDHRARRLRETLLNPHTKAIWAGRGGYGAAEVIQIFEQTGFTLPTNRVVPLIGFSDFTAFHSLAAHCQWPTLHGPVANYNKEMNELTGGNHNNETSIKPLIDILKGETQEITYILKNINPNVLQHPRYSVPITTKIVGGNFSVIQRSLGTATQLNADHSILFLEDTSENIYRLRSLLAGVARTGLFDKVVALFFGSFPITGGTLEELLLDLSNTLQTVRGVNIPILLNPDFGHGAVNHILPLGTLTTLTFQPDGNAHLTASTYSQNE